MVTIYVRWQVPQGWTYTAYNQADDPTASHQTLLPVAMEPVSAALAGFPDTQHDAVDDRKDAIKTALLERFPQARVEFVDMRKV